MGRERETLRRDQLWPMGVLDLSVEMIILTSVATLTLPAVAMGSCFPVTGSMPL